MIKIKASAKRNKTATAVARAIGSAGGGVASSGYASEAGHAKTADNASEAETALRAKTADNALHADEADNAKTLDGHTPDDFLRKDRSDRTPFDLSVGNRLTAEQRLDVGPFIGGLDGRGARIDADGNAEMDSLTLRRFLEVPELRYNRTEVSVGNQWNAPGGGIIERVEVKSATKGTIYLKLEEGEIGAVYDDAVSMGIYHFESGNADSDSDDGQGNFRFSGFTTVYFSIDKGTIEDYDEPQFDDNGDPVLDELGNQIKIRKANAKFDYTLRGGGWNTHPCAMMTFVCYGCFDPNDHSHCRSAYSTRTYTRYLENVHSWNFNSGNVALQQGDLSNLTINGRHLDGYGLYCANLNYTGTMHHIDAPLSIELSLDGDQLLATDEGGICVQAYLKRGDIIYSPSDTEHIEWSVERATSTTDADENGDASWEGDITSDGLLTVHREDFGNANQALFIITAKITGLDYAQEDLSQGVALYTVDGMQGRGVTATEISYRTDADGELTDAELEAKSDWVSDMPTVGQGQWLYTRTITVWSAEPKRTVSYAKSYNGKDGQSVRQIDLSDEITPLPVDAEGRLRSSVTVETVISLFDGAQKVPLKVGDVSTSLFGLGFAQPTYTENNGSIVLSAYIPAAMKIDSTSGINVKIGSLSAVWKFIPIRGSKWYNLLTTPDSISRLKDGSLSAQSVKVQTIRFEDDKAPVTCDTPDSGLTVKYLYEGITSSETALSGNTIELSDTAKKNATAVVVRLYSGTVMIDAERIPIVADGEDGDNGDSARVETTESKYLFLGINSQPSESLMTMNYQQAVSNWLKDHSSLAGAYLWSLYYITTYKKDGTSGVETKTSERAVWSVSRIGEDGAGGDGLHVAYAKDITYYDDGSVSADGFSYTSFTGAEWIGVCVLPPEITEDPDDAEAYEWTKIKGEDGKDGKDAVTVELSPNVVVCKKGEIKEIRISILIHEGKNVTSYFQGVQVNKVSSGLWIGGNAIRYNGLDNAKISFSYYGTEFADTSVTANITYNGTVYDVPLQFVCVKDGEQGPIGPIGPQGQIIRITEWASGKQYYDGTTVASDGMKYLDIVTIFSNGAQSIYKCTASHESTYANAPTTPTGKSYWQEFDMVNPIYTPLLLADTARIQFLNSQEIVIYQNGTVVARLGAPNNGNIMYAGGTTADLATYTLDSSGRARYGSKLGERIEIDPTSARRDIRIFDSTGALKTTLDGKAVTGIDTASASVVAIECNDLNVSSGGYTWYGVAATAPKSGTARLTANGNISVTVSFPAESVEGRYVNFSFYISINGDSVAPVTGTVYATSTSAHSVSATLPVNRNISKAISAGGQYFPQIRMSVSKSGGTYNPTVSVAYKQFSARFVYDDYQATYGNNGLRVSQTSDNYFHAICNNGVLDLRAMRNNVSVFPMMVYHAEWVEHKTPEVVYDPYGISLYAAASESSVLYANNLSGVKSLMPGGVYDPTRIVVNLSTIMMLGDGTSFGLARFNLFGSSSLLVDSRKVQLAGGNFTYIGGFAPVAITIYVI